MKIIEKLNGFCSSKNFEKNLTTKIVDNSVLLSFIVLTVLAIVIRYSVRDYRSPDFDAFLVNWFKYFKTHGGYAALGTTIGDYNVPYQILIATMAYINVKALYQFKILSCLFDFLLAVSSGSFVYYICCKRKGIVCSVKNAFANVSFVLPYCVVLFLPTVVLNSALWAQCDAIYTTFVILSLFFVYRKNYFFSFVFLGCAFAFKLQAVFILPFFFYLYFRERKFSILFLLFIPVVGIVLSIPSLCMGLPLYKIFDIYVNQTSSYQAMYLNYPSFWALLGDNYQYLKLLSVIVTFIILLGGLLFVIVKKVELESNNNFLKISTWTVWTCVMFLPSMHERYAYLPEIMSVILFFVIFWSKERNGLSVVFIVACVLQLSTCMTYGRFLLDNTIVGFDLILLIHVSAYLIFTYSLYVGKMIDNTNLSEED